MDKAYDNPTGEEEVASHGYMPHIWRIGEEKLDPTTGEKRFPPRRWVVERTLAWLSKCRALLIRYDKHARTSWGCCSSPARSPGFAVCIDYPY
jgi:putative transposase